MTESETRWLAAAVAGAALCCALAYQLNTAREQTRAALTQLTAVRERANELERTARTTRASAASGQVDSPAPTTTPSTEAKAHDVKQTLREARRAVEAAQRKMYTDPEARAILRASQKVRLRSTHPDLARVLRLSLEQEDQLREVLAEQQLRQMERYAAARDLGRFDFEEMQRTVEPERMAVLGAEKYALFKRYTETLPERRRVQMFAAQLDEQDGLQDESAERLITALAAVRTAREEKEKQRTRDQRMSMYSVYGVAVMIENGDDGLQKAVAELEEADRRAASVAAPVLSSNQLRQFTRFLERSREATLAHVAESLVEVERP